MSLLKVKKEIKVSSFEDFKNTSLFNAKIKNEKDGFTDQEQIEFYLEKSNKLFCCFFIDKKDGYFVIREVEVND